MVKQTENRQKNLKMNVIKSTPLFLNTTYLHTSANFLTVFYYIIVLRRRNVYLFRTLTQLGWGFFMKLYRLGKEQ